MNWLWVWRFDLLYLFCLVVAAAVLSLYIGLFLHMLVLILTIFFLRQLYLITRLELWLREGGKKNYTKYQGVWGDIYFHFFQIKKGEKKRKKKLGKIIKQFHKSTDVLPDAAIVLGNHNEIEWSNYQAYLVLGIKKSDRGQRLDNLIRLPEFIDFLKSTEADRKLTIISPVEKNVILQFRIVNYGLGQQLIIAHDITQQKNTESMRKKFVANVSHELRTPLTVLKGYLETLQQTDNGESKILTQSLGNMLIQTERMQYLIDDLLLLARLESKKMENDCVDIVSLIRQICAESSMGNGSKRIVLNIESKNKMFGAKQDLLSAFSNIVENALKYSEQDKPVTVSWKKGAGGMIFDVVDQGEGIADYEIPRITERFYRVDLNRSVKLSGTGLGLAIVKHVLIRHDARLEITSKVGKGSRFRCIFPATRLC